MKQFLCFGSVHWPDHVNHGYLLAFGAMVLKYEHIDEHGVFKRAFSGREINFGDRREWVMNTPFFLNFLSNEILAICTEIHRLSI